MMRSNRISKKSSACAVLAAVGALATPAWAGPVKILSQSQVIRATADSSNPGAGQTVVASAADAGPFHASVTANDTGAGFLTTATGTMNSSLGVDHFTFDGMMHFQTSETRAGAAFPWAEVGYDINIVFEVDEVYSYRFQRVHDVDYVVMNVPIFDAEGGVYSLGKPLFDNAYYSVGTLQPGVYTLGLTSTNYYGGDLVEPQSKESVFSTLYDIDLTFARAADRLDPNVVPLPPAVWSGAALLGAGAIARLSRRRRD